MSGCCMRIVERFKATVYADDGQVVNACEGFDSEYLAAKWASLECRGQRWRVISLTTGRLMVYADSFSDTYKASRAQKLRQCEVNDVYLRQSELAI